MDDEVRDIAVPEEPAPVESAPETEAETAAEPSADRRQPNWGIVALVGVLMLAVGAFLGYTLRPLYGPEAQAAKATQAAAAVAAQTQAAQNQDLMKYAISQVRHWQGDENAPVTIIEFSDFQ